VLGEPQQTKAGRKNKGKLGVKPFSVCNRAKIPPINQTTWRTHSGIQSTSRATQKQQQYLKVGEQMESSSAPKPMRLLMFAYLHEGK
jgi:hypothetical protein